MAPVDDELRAALSERRITVGRAVVERLVEEESERRVEVVKAVAKGTEVDEGRRVEVERIMEVVVGTEVPGATDMMEGRSPSEFLRRRESAKTHPFARSQSQLTRTPLALDLCSTAASPHPLA